MYKYSMFNQYKDTYMNYEKLYENLIANRRKLGTPEGYTEKHHIIPRSFGGTETIELNPGQRLVNITWKEAELWILTKKDTTKPTTYSFKEKTLYGNIEGEGIVIEK